MRENDRCGAPQRNPSLPPTPCASTTASGGPLATATQWPPGSELSRNRHLRTHVHNSFK